MAIANYSQEKTDQQNTEYCKSIADRLYLIATGEAYKDPDTDEIVYDEDETTEDYEQASMFDYFSDVLDIQYTVGYDRTYKGVRMLVAFGGPNIWVDTMTGNVELYWWSDRASYPLDRLTIDAIDDVAAELWECGA